MVATVGYVGSAGAKLYWARNINLPDPGPGAVDPRRPYAAHASRRHGNHVARKFGELVLLVDADDAREALQQRLLFPRQLDMVALARQLSAATEARTGPIPQDPRNRRADWASSNSDVRHRVNLASTYLLPFGPGRQVCESGGGSWVTSSAVGRSAESPCCKAVCLLPSRCRVLLRTPERPAAPIPSRESNP